MAYPFSDLGLARRLETTEGLACARSVEARARVDPSSGACWIEVAGARAMFDGVTSPVTQTFGLGMAGQATAQDFETIEGFFRAHGAPIFHEVSPLADFMLQMGRVGAATENAQLYLAEIDGRPIATASLRIHEGVAFLAGASCRAADRSGTPSVTAFASRTLA
jgi:hypothetical protein